MITIISPAKNMKAVKRDDLQLGRPKFPEKTAEVIEKLRTYQPWELESLMKINEKLAMQAFVDIKNFDIENEGTAAILAYDGLVFKNMNVGDFSIEELQYADSHLRILSACYGIESALDSIQPYRLEMQCKMKVNGENLYEFWGEEIYRELYAKDKVILNLASEEYAKSVRKYVKSDTFIDVEFLTYHKGKLRTLATWAKMARGQMVRYIIKNRIDTPEGIKAFDWNGYEHEENLSNEKKYVFVMR